MGTKENPPNTSKKGKFPKKASRNCREPSPDWSVEPTWQAGFSSVFTSITSISSPSTTSSFVLLLFFFFFFSTNCQDVSCSAGAHCGPRGPPFQPDPGPHVDENPRLPWWSRQYWRNHRTLVLFSSFHPFPFFFLYPSLAIAVAAVNYPFFLKIFFSKFFLMAGRGFYLGILPWFFNFFFRLFLSFFILK